jgi:hypothetical protein
LASASRTTNLITKEEKGALDDWYIRHASLWLDARIALLTLRVLFRGERRSEQAVSEAYAARRATSYERGQRARPERRREQSAAVRLKPAGQAGTRRPQPSERLLSRFALKRTQQSATN